MTAEDAALEVALRGLLKFSSSVLPDYATDPLVQRRVGKVLAKIPANVRINSVGDTWS
jgi:hypothetical protein